MSLQYPINEDKIKAKLTALMARLAYDYELEKPLDVIEEFAMHAIEAAVSYEINSIVSDMKPKEIYFLMDQILSMKQQLEAKKNCKKRVKKKKPVDNQ